MLHSRVKLSFSSLNLSRPE